MIKRRKPTIFFGWWMNLVTGIVSGLSWGFYGLGISVLFKPIASELGLSRAVASVAAGVGRLGGGVWSPLAGWLTDRFGPKWVILTGMFLIGIGLALMNFVNSAWSYYLVWGVMIGAGSNLGITIAVDKMLTNWFVSKRGLAFGVRFALVAICGAIVLPLVTWLLVAEGWRITCLIWSGVIFVLIPITWHFIRQNRPEYYGLLPDGAAFKSDLETDIEQMIEKGVQYAAGFGETEFTLKQALRTPAYWMLNVVRIIQSILNGSITVHVVPFLTDMGIDPILAGSLMAMMVFFQIPSMFFGGFFTDRVRKSRLGFLLALAFLFQGLGIAVFLLNQTTTTVYPFLILYGLGQGAVMPVSIALGGRYFGRKAYGSIQGSSHIFVAPVGLLAPIYTGWVYDTTGSYISAFILFAILAAVATALMCLLRPPKLTGDAGDTRRFF